MATATQNKETARITEWITGGPYAVAVEIEAQILPDRPGVPFLTPQTVRFLEQISRDASAGNVAALRTAGKVFVLLEGVNGSQVKPKQEYA